MPLTIRVRAGDTLSKLAQRWYGSSKLWPALWWINRKAVPNPEALGAKYLRLSAWHPDLAWVRKRALAAIPAPPAPVSTSTGGTSGTTPPPAPPPGAGIYSYGQLESLWVSAGGPSWAEASAATIAECESGGNPRAYNPSGASGLWQILGQVVAGNIFDPMVNALNAVAKFRASGDTFAQWVCTAAVVKGAHRITATLLSSSAKTFGAAVTPLRLRVFRWAIRNIKGCWYRYGGTGPCSSGYDCSGAVMTAWRHFGIALPRTAAEIQSSWHLVRISARQARKGDIVAWGFPAFHVELVAYKWRWTFGEHTTGTRASTVRTWSAPHAFYRVR